MFYKCKVFYNHQRSELKFGNTTYVPRSKGEDKEETFIIKVLHLLLKTTQYS